jgi:transcriptional antiterminator NusG
MVQLTKPSRKRWYIVQTYSGQEVNAAEDIMHRAKTQDVAEYIHESLVPMIKENVKNLKTNLVEEKERILYPGYVYVNMELDPDGKAWYVVRNTPKVTGILGSSGKLAQPVPVPPSDMQSIFAKIGRTEVESLAHWLDKLVEVTSGTLKGQRYFIKDYDNEKKLLYYEIELFGMTQRLSIDPKTIKEVK